jgi:hypothetical protein
MEESIAIMEICRTLPKKAAQYQLRGHVWPTGCLLGCSQRLPRFVQGTGVNSVRLFSLQWHALRVGEVLRLTYDNFWQRSGEQLWKFRLKTNPASGECILRSHPLSMHD